MQELGLPVNPDVPLLGFIGRLDYQKGVDLIRDNFDWLMGEGAQLVLLGSGREDLEEALRWGHAQCGLMMSDLLVLVRAVHHHRMAMSVSKNVTHQHEFSIHPVHT